MPRCKATLKEFKAAIAKWVAESGMEPAEINTGWCADFATIIFNKFEEVVILTDQDLDPCREYTHTFMKFRGKYYDSECLNGTTNWERLPIFVRQKE